MYKISINIGESLRRDYFKKFIKFSNKVHPIAKEFFQLHPNFYERF